MHKEEIVTLNDILTIKDIETVSNLQRDPLDYLKSDWIDGKLRKFFVEYILTICLSLKFKRSTFYRAVQIFDKSLNYEEGLTKSEIRVIALCTIDIAAKLEEIHCPLIRHYKKVFKIWDKPKKSTDSFIKGQFRKYFIDKQIEILSLLDWKMNTITIYDLMRNVIFLWDNYQKKLTKDVIINTGWNLNLKPKPITFLGNHPESSILYKRITMVIEVIVHDDAHVQFSYLNLVICALFTVVAFRLNILFFSKENKNMYYYNKAFFQLLFEMIKKDQNDYDEEKRLCLNIVKEFYVFCTMNLSMEVINNNTFYQCLEYVLDIYFLIKCDYEYVSLLINEPMQEYHSDQANLFSIETCLQYSPIVNQLKIILRDKKKFLKKKAISK